MEYLKQKQKQEEGQQQAQDDKMAEYKSQMPNVNSYKNPKMPKMSSGGMKMPKI